MLDRRVTVTIFPDLSARTKTEERLSLRQIAERALATNAASKDDLSLIKGAIFGDQCTDKGSLRHNANVRAITLLLADYDGGEIGIPEAAARLNAARIAAVIYTSPSHTAAKPRWRVGCLLSAELSPSEHARMMARLNGVLGGILAAESFTLSQAYYIGSVNSNPDHTAELVEGRCIDEADNLDVGAIWPARSAGSSTNTARPPRPEGMADDAYAQSVLDKACGLITADHPGGRHGSMLEATWMVAPFVLSGHLDEAECVARIQEAMANDGREANAGEVESALRGALGMATPYEPPSDGSEFEAMDDDPAADQNAAPDDDPAEQIAAPDESWLGMLQRSPPSRAYPDGAIKPNLLNGATALIYAPAWCGRFRWDEFTWRPTIDGRAVTDHDHITVSCWLQSQDIQVDPRITKDAIVRVAYMNKYHPVREMLRSLVWDGVRRLDTWLIDYAGAEDTPLNRAVSRKWLIALVARPLRPGCKVDTMLILEGPQGLKKSTLFKIIAGNDEWFVDNLRDLSTKDTKIQLQGKWIVEFAELDHLSRSEVSTVKAFMTTTNDPYRGVWGIASEDHPRQCVFAGTVNRGGNGYLKDETGGRRFWPVACGVGWGPDRKIDDAGLRTNRDQLLAEAVVAFDAGETWWLETTDLEALQAEAAGERFADDVWGEKIRSFIAGRPCVTTDEIFQGCLSKPLRDCTNAHAQSVARVLTAAGWVKIRIRMRGTQVRVFVPADTEGARVAAKEHLEPSAAGETDNVFDFGDYCAAKQSPGQSGMTDAEVADLMS
jgi:hypothetical protein